MAFVNSSFVSSYGTFTISREDVSATISVSFNGSTIVSGLKYEASNTSSDYQGAMQCACLLIQAKVQELASNTLNTTWSNTLANTNVQLANNNALIANTNVQVDKVNTTLANIHSVHVKLEDSITQLRQRGVNEQLGIVTRNQIPSEDQIRRDITTAYRVAKTLTD